MSGIVRGIGKVFKGVVKVVKKVALPALMIGAVVLTGGAALGVLPALGTMVGSLGLSAGLSTVLTGAISTGAIGAVGGFLTGGMKGAKKGFLMGALTGGALGAAGAIGPNGILGGLGKTAATGMAPTAGVGGAGLPGGATSLMLPGGSTIPMGGASASAGALGGVATGATGSVAAAAGAPAAAAATAPAAGGGIFGMLNSNPLLASQLMGGVSQAFAPNEYNQRANADRREAERAGYYAYGGGSSTGKRSGMVPGVYSSQADPFGVASQTYAPPPNLGYTPPARRWVFNPSTNAVEEVPAGGN